MRLILNASRVPFEPTGIFRYATLLAAALDDLRCELMVLRSNRALLVPGVVRDIPRWLAGRRRSRLFPVYWYLYALTLRLPPNTPIISATQHLIPFRRDQVASILDMRPYSAPDTLLQFVYSRAFRFGVRRLRGVITISEASKREIADVYGIDPSKIHVVYLHHPDTNPVHPTYPRKPFLLMVGASFKHKNLHLALRNHAAWSGDFRLVVIASRTRYVEEMQRLARDLDIAERVDFRTDVTDAQRNDLYSQAAALVYVSTKEGFGIPPLEAMSFGTPCLLSDIPVFRELYGGAALFFDPTRVADWSRVLALLPDLSPGHSLLEEGYRRAASFSRERTVEMLKRALHSLYSE